MDEPLQKPDGHRIPNFRWRILPAFAMIGLAALIAILFFNNVIVGGVPVTHRAHFLIFVAGLVFAVAAILFFRNHWILGTIGAITGFVLPFLRSI